jgi:hypothetical protein
MNHFPILILIGRPASGKSEIIDFLIKMPNRDRISNYRIATLDVIDDFPMLWTWFEEDNILSRQLNKPRLHTDDKGYFLQTYFWDLLVERLSLEYEKRLRDNSAYHTRTTTIIEFSRGREHGGYQRALAHLSSEILKNAVILYVKVSYQESFRKNRRRFNPQRPYSTLEHALPDEKIERLYRNDDWEDLTSEALPYLKVRSHRIPYVVFENEDDVTSAQLDQLGNRLKDSLSCLWELRQDG